MATVPPQTYCWLHIPEDWLPLWWRWNTVRFALSGRMAAKRCQASEASKSADQESQKPQHVGIRGRFRTARAQHQLFSGSSPGTSRQRPVYGDTFSGCLLRGIIFCSHFSDPLLHSPWTLMLEIGCSTLAPMGCEFLPQWWGLRPTAYSTWSISKTR